VREFKDQRGRQWQVWEVRPEAIYPQTRAEDYLAECFRDGWLVFETTDALEKRRLCPPPYAWEQRSDTELERLAGRAEILRPLSRKRPRQPSRADLPPSVPRDIAATMPRDDEGNLDIRYLGVVRSFYYPGGQVWRAQVVASDDTHAEPVLRFTSPSHDINLTEWPLDWVDLSDNQLVELLRIGESIEERRHDAAPKRRYGDPRTDV